MIRKNLKQELLHCIYNFVKIRRSSLRKVEKKLPVSFDMINNLLNETKVIDVTKLLKSHVKTRSFCIGYCKHEQKKYVIIYKTSIG